METTMTKIAITRINSIRVNALAPRPPLFP